MDEMMNEHKVKVRFADFQNDADASSSKTPEAIDMLEMYNNYYDDMQQENQLPSSPSKMSYRLGEYDNQILHEADLPSGFEVNRTDFGSYMHEVFEAAVNHKLDDYTLAVNKLDDDVVIELNEVEQDYAVILFNRFLSYIDLNAEYLTEHTVKGVVNNILYEGSADLIELHDDETFTVIDYKNYKSLSEEDIQAHLTQCRIYATAYAKQTGKTVREIKVHYPMQDLTESETYIG